MTARREDIEGLPDWPRRLSREQAAAYVGLSPSKFDEDVEAGRLPRPVPRTDRVVRWDRAALDLALDAEMGVRKAPAPAGQDAITERMLAYHRDGHQRH